MTRCLALLFLVPCSGLVTVPLAGQGGEPAEAHRVDRDRVVLRNGQAFEGRIVEEEEDSLRLELVPGQRIGFRKASLAGIERARPGAEPEAVTASEIEWGLHLDPRSEWFQLRDEEGRLVGTLHRSVEREDAGYRFEEEWYFLERIEVDLGRGRLVRGRTTRLAERARGADQVPRSRLEATLVSCIERVDMDGQPMSLYTREAVIDALRERVVMERIRQGDIAGGTLVLREQDFDGRRGRTIGFDRGTAFGLCIEERLRQKGRDGVRSLHATVFDPLTESFELGHWSVLDGEPVPESRFPETVPGKGRALLIESRQRERRRREWVAPGGRVLLVEVNGVELVGEPVSADTCFALRRSRKLEDVVMSPLRIELAGFEVFVPRATWAIVRPPRDAKLVRMVASRPELEVRLRHMSAPREVDGSLATVGEALMRRFGLDHAWCKLRDQRVVGVGGRDWVRMEGEGRDGELGQRGAVLFVTRGLDGYLLVECSGPAEVLAELRDEVDELIATVRPTGNLVVQGD